MVFSRGPHGPAPPRPAQRNAEWKKLRAERASPQDEKGQQRYLEEFCCGLGYGGVSMRNNNCCGSAMEGDENRSSTGKQTLTGEDGDEDHCRAKHREGPNRTFVVQNLGQDGGQHTWQSVMETNPETVKAYWDGNISTYVCLAEDTRTQNP